MFCSKCGKEINDDAVICVHCGCAVNGNSGAVTGGSTSQTPPKERSWLVTVLLSWFLGSLGAHRFYTGHIGLAVLQLLTLGGCGIWALIDFICICFNSFKDAEGNALVNYNKTTGIIIFVVALLLWILSFLFNLIIGALSAA